MKNAFWRVLTPLLAITVSSCADVGGPASSEDANQSMQGVKYSGGDGSSCDRAVIIAEYVWLDREFPGHSKRLQSLGSCANRPADFLKIVTLDGREIEVVFDISNFFGPSNLDQHPDRQRENQ